MTNQSKHRCPWIVPSDMKRALVLILALLEKEFTILLGEEKAVICHESYEMNCHHEVRLDGRIPVRSVISGCGRSFYAEAKEGDVTVYCISDNEITKIEIIPKGFYSYFLSMVPLLEIAYQCPERNESLTPYNINAYLFDKILEKRMKLGNVIYTIKAFL